MDFVGIGAERCGTSWIYACLYEHPELCAPIKELHFFSRERYGKGIGWYVGKFGGCADGSLKGEYSTSYLYSPLAAERIHAHFPEAKVIVCLRNPIDRAYSQYRNEIKAGHIGKETTFERYSAEESSVLEQGLYAEQLARYLKYFERSQVHVLIYEESKEDPERFIRSIYTFLGVDPSFTPSMLRRKVNTSRTPKGVGVDRSMIHVAETLRHLGLDKLVWLVKKSGLPKLLRRVNTEADDRTLDQSTHEKLKGFYREDVTKLGELLGRDMVEVWRLGRN